MSWSPNFVLIIVCLICGWLLRRSGKMPQGFAQSLNTYVVWVALPAVMAQLVPRLLDSVDLSVALLVPVSMGWLQFVLAMLCFGSLEKRGMARTTVGALILTAGLGNTSFVGLPLLESLYGQEAMQIGLLVDQPGTFLALSSLGIVVASLYSPTQSHRPSARAILVRVLCFPPFVALLLTITWFLGGCVGQPVVQPLADRLAATLVPVVLIAVGFQLSVTRAVLARQWRPLCLGLAFKLVLSPLFFLGLYVWLCGASGLATRVTILEAAMAPMITAAVVADEFGLNSELGTLMVGLGIPISIATVPLWNLCLQTLAV